MYDEQKRSRFATRLVTFTSQSLTGIKSSVLLNDNILNLIFEKLFLSKIREEPHYAIPLKYLKFQVKFRDNIMRNVK